MTRIRMDFRPEEGRYELVAEGHAGYKPGNDIVCASVSAVLWSLAGALENCRELCGRLEHEEKSGAVRILCVSRAREVEGMFFLTAVGVRQIEARYPEHVSVVNN